VRADEADVFHTRQQHTLKVAQVGRRLAEKLLTDQQAFAEHYGLDPEVVEGACLAHDLGHPPFGHAGEHKLNALVLGKGDDDGFEGNAQSFRILTRHAVRFEEAPGLDLTRATLAATLKYPVFKTSPHQKKWGAYKSEKDDLDFARQYCSTGAKTLEAELMDWADDVAYSVHDLEDFHRCAAIPWTYLFSHEGKEKLVAGAQERWRNAPTDAAGQLREAARRLEAFFDTGFSPLLKEKYEGTRSQRQQLRTLTSALIKRYMEAASLKDPNDVMDGVCIAIDGELDAEVRFLKQVTWDYIISNPSLAAQQKGQERIIEQLFDDFHDDAESASGPPSYLPQRLRYLWSADVTPARFAADCVANLTENEAVALHARLSGTSGGSVLDPIAR